MIVLRNPNKHKCDFHYAAMPMMMSEILKFVNFTKTQESRYLENEPLFFLQIKKFSSSIIHTKGYFIAKK